MCLPKLYIKPGVVTVAAKTNVPPLTIRYTKWPALKNAFDKLF